MNHAPMEKHRVPLKQMSVQATLPADWKEGTFIGRVWRPDVKGPSIVTLGQDGYLYDITASFSTISKLLEEKNPAAAARQAQARGEKLGSMSDILTHTQSGSPGGPTLM